MHTRAKRVITVLQGNAGERCLSYSARYLEQSCWKLLECFAMSLFWLKFGSRYVALRTWIYRIHLVLSTILGLLWVLQVGREMRPLTAVCWILLERWTSLRRDQRLVAPILTLRSEFR